MKKSYIFDPAILSNLSCRRLFYPCSGGDLIEPIRIFSPWINEFWFVDRAYFSSDWSKPADQQKPVLLNDPDYQFLDKTIEGPVTWDSNDRNIIPCILSEIYLHKPSQQEVVIKRRRGYGYSALRKNISKLGVFFYRGDSRGEGGSGNLWLTRSHVDEICSKLVNGGLLVTDGSQSSMSNIYYIFGRYNDSRHPNMKVIRAHVENATTLVDHLGRTFTCIGYVGNRYGPTFVWQYWEAQNSWDYQNCSTAKPVVLSHSIPLNNSNSLQLPQHLLDSIKVAANARGMSYQSLIEVWLKEKLLSQ